MAYEGMFWIICELKWPRYGTNHVENYKWKQYVHPRHVEDDLLVAESRAALGRCLSKQDKIEEANTLLKEALKTFEDAGKQDDRRALEIEKWLKEVQ